MIKLIKKDGLIWLIYCLYMLILILPNMLIPAEVQLIWHQKIWSALMIIICLLPAKLVSVYIGLPQLISKIIYKNHSWTKVTLLLVLSISLGLVLYRGALYFYIYPYIYERKIDSKEFFGIGRFISNFADLTVPMLLFGAKWLLDARLQSDQEKKALELQYLKHQTSPHFLFNALNSIYGLVRKNDINAAPAIMKLSGLLRYLLYESTVSKIQLNKELEMVDQFLEVQKLRFGNTLQLTVEANQMPDKKEIAPGLLLPLLENAFKFGFNDQLNLIVVDIKLQLTQDNRLHISIQNYHSDTKTNEIGGLGLKTLLRRLQLEYPNQHEYEAKLVDKFYIAHLILNLD